MQARSQRFGGMMAELKHNPHRGKLERAATAVVQPVAWPTRGLFVLLSKKGSSSRLTTLPRRGAGVRAVKLALCASLFAVTASAQSSADWIIDTFVGRAYVQENVPATEERLDFPQGVAVDSAGKPLYYRQEKPLHSHGGPFWDHHHHRGNWRARPLYPLRRGRRPSHRGPTALPHRRGGGRCRQSLHCFSESCSQGKLLGNHLHHRGYGRVRLQWGRRPSHRSPAKQPLVASTLTPSAISTSPMRATTASAKWTPWESSPRSRARESLATVATAPTAETEAQPSKLHLTTLVA